MVPFSSLIACSISLFEYPSSTIISLDPALHSNESAGMPVCPECQIEVSQYEIETTGKCCTCGFEFNRDPQAVRPNVSPSSSSGAGPLKGMNESEYRSCLSNLGLLEGENVRLQYVCLRHVMSPPSVWRKEPRIESNKGLLVFTGDNMIFMQQEGAWSSNYSQALRMPLEQITGIVSGGTMISHIRITIGPETHEFINFKSTYGTKNIHEVRGEIEKHLKDVREERKRIAQQTLAGSVAPQVIFCKYCGARNKTDQSRCGNCSAVLT